MNKLFILLTLLCPLLLNAQSQGTVSYQETAKMTISLPEGPENDELRKMMPPSQTFKQMLFFTEQASLYRAPEEKDPAEDVEVKHEEEDMNVKIVMKRPENKVYRDLDKGETIESRELFGRFFLITNPSVSHSWKLTGEQKKILDYNCQKAVLQDTSRNVVAWFAPQIPVAIGPGEFGDLPGLILELDIDNGNRTVVASKVDLTVPAKGLIEKPTKGKEVTREEFKNIVAEKNKEMGADGGGNMRVIIRN